MYNNIGSSLHDGTSMHCIRTYKNMCSSLVLDMEETHKLHLCRSKIFYNSCKMFLQDNLSVSIFLGFGWHFKNNAKNVSYLLKAIGLEL